MWFDGLSETRAALVAKMPDQQLQALHQYQDYLSRHKNSSPLPADNEHDTSENTERTAQNSEVPNKEGGASSSTSGRPRKTKFHDREDAMSAAHNKGKRKKVSASSTPLTLRSETPPARGGKMRSTVQGRRRGRGLGQKRSKSPDPSKVHGIKSGSCFYNLPYWKHLLIQNSLNIMHCEKDFAKNLMKTICGVKEKDSVKVRRDMEREGIRKHLWMVKDPNNNSRMLKPVANYVLTAKEFDIFSTRLENIKVPSGYCPEIGAHIRNRKFEALKSHDYHILMQTLLPLALRRLMEENTRMAIMRSCRVFRRLCCKVWDPMQEENLREDVAITM